MKDHDLKEVLRRNPQLDHKRIAELAAYQQRMENAGANFRTEYRVQPALGSLTSSLASSTATSTPSDEIDP